MNNDLDALNVLNQLKDFVLEHIKKGLDRRIIVGSFDIIEQELKEKEFLQENYNNLNEFYFNLWQLTEDLKSQKHTKNLAIKFINDKFCLVDDDTDVIYKIVDDIKGDFRK